MEIPFAIGEASAAAGAAAPAGAVAPVVGASPGVEHDEIVSLSGSSAPVPVTCIDYGPARAQLQEISSWEDLEAFLVSHRPEWSAVRWINVDSLANMRVIHSLATKYDLHPLAVEDLLHVRQRAKVDAYGGEETGVQARLFIVVRMLEMQDERLVSDQISMFLGHNTLLTFQQEPGDVWNPIRQRIQTKGSRLRGSDASFLAYSLIDAIVDHFFPILEHYGDRMDELETVILEDPPRGALDKIHQIKRDLLLLRAVAWPMRELVLSLQRENHECVSDATRLYLRDLHDHVVQVIEITETFRERASDLTDSYMSRVSNRMNEIMKVLTIIGTIFIPLTFLAGVYGMNFRHFPELDMGWAYPAFWVICLILAGIMLLFFRRKGWL
ncbi:MAG: magnesium/cobalt transporter CorA [Nitrososphaerales archaeon]